MDKIKKAFILGAGYGTRLRPLTDRTPKPLLAVRGRPLIFHILDSLIGAGVEEFFINTHHLAGCYGDFFKEGSYLGRPVCLLHEQVLLDTGGGLKNLVGRIGCSEPIIVHNGDIFLTSPLEAFVKAALSEGSSEGTLLLRSEGKSKNVGICGKDVVDLRFKRGVAFEKTAQFTGVFAAKPSMLRAFLEYGEDVFSSVDVFLKILACGGKLSAYFMDDGIWSDIGTLDEYMKLK